MKYYANGRYYCSEIEAIEAMSHNLNELAHYINEFPVKLASGRIQPLPEHHNCRNCGAPVFGYKCDYCGTKY